MNFAGSFYAVSGTPTLNLDVLAMNDSVGKWTSFQIGSYNGGNAGCNFWGLVTPPLN